MWICWMLKAWLIFQVLALCQSNWTKLKTSANTLFMVFSISTSTFCLRICVAVENIVKGDIYCLYFCANCCPFFPGQGYWNLPRFVTYWKVMPFLINTIISWLLLLILLLLLSPPNKTKERNHPECLTEHLSLLRRAQFVQVCVSLTAINWVHYPFSLGKFTILPQELLSCCALPCWCTWTSQWCTIQSVDSQSSNCMSFTTCWRWGTIWGPAVIAGRVWALPKP